MAQDAQQSGRRIAVVTGARSDYGLLYWILKGIESAPDLTLQLFVTGMHLAPEFGATESVIVEDGFPIAERVETLLASDSRIGLAKSIGLGVIGFADAFSRREPDIVLLLGDRFETFAAAQAAMALRLPIAHVHGGEVTEGAVDEQMRHAISKMAAIHFVAAVPFRDRLIRMGERPERIIVSGAPGLDNLALLPLPDRETLAADLGLPLNAPVFVVTYHPATLGAVDPLHAFAALADALDCFPQATIVLTMPNADPGGRGLMAAQRRFAEERPERVRAVTSLGQKRYLGLLKIADAVIGNSSSGLIEAPAAGAPTVNIGPRQQGRLRGDTVIDCAEDAAAIEAAIRQALAPELRDRAARRVSPYGTPGAIATAIVDTLRRAPLDVLAQKTFHDAV